VGLVYFNNPPIYIGGSIASGRTSHARQVGGEKPDEEANHQSSSKARCWALRP
jgi:hypothetical protein